MTTISPPPPSNWDSRLFPGPALPPARIWLFTLACYLLPVASLWANPEPAITHVVAAPRTDGSGIVDISYTLSDNGNDKFTVSVLFSADGGATWTIFPSSTALSGAVGPDIPPGNHIITWSSKADLPGALGDNYRVKVSTDDIEWIPIPAGTFQMGDSIGDGDADEVPIHIVTLSSFKMSKHEVTNAQYAQFLNESKARNKFKEVDGIIYASTDTANGQPWFNTTSATGWPNNGEYSQIVSSGGTYSVRSRDGQSQNNHPVVCVSWYGAQAFCDFYGYQLPTEAQWEYAARGGLSGQRFPWGANITYSEANYDGHPTYATETRPYTAPVGSFSANGYGLCDMPGNVWEWCADWYGVRYYSVSPSSDPSGPTRGDYGNRVIRGGSWVHIDFHCRVANRSGNLPDQRSYPNGFRVCRP